MRPRPKFWSRPRNIGLGLHLDLLASALRPKVWLRGQTFGLDLGFGVEGRVGGRGRTSTPRLRTMLYRYETEAKILVSASQHWPRPPSRPASLRFKAKGLASSGLEAKVLASPGLDTNWPRDQNFGIGLGTLPLTKDSSRPSGLCLKAKTLASAWPRGQTFGLDLGLGVEDRGRGRE